MDEETSNVETPASQAADAEVQAAIDAIVAEQGDASEDTPVEAADAPQSEAAPDEVPVVEAAPSEPPPQDAITERLVQREVALLERERTVKAAEANLARYKELEAEHAQLKERVAKIDSLGHDPMSALEASGHDPEQVVRLYLAQKMAKDGKQVPAELQNAIKEAQINAKLRSIEEAQRSYEQRQAAERFYAQVDQGAQSYVKGEIKNAPTVANVAKANPARVYAEIMDEIVRDASSPGKDPKAPVLSYEEAAARVEKRWSDLRGLFGPASPAQVSSATPQPSTKVAPATKGTSATVTTKPLTTPKPTPKSERQIVDDIVNEVLRGSKL